MSEQIIGKTNNQIDESTAQSIEITLSTRTVIRLVLLVLLVLFIVDAVKLLVGYLSFLLLLIVMAIFFAYLVAPLVELVQGQFASRGQARWMPRSLAIAIVYVFIFVSLFGAGSYLLPLVSEQVSQFTKQFPEYNRQIRLRLEELDRRFERTAMPPALREGIENSLARVGGLIEETAPVVLTTVAAGLFTLLPALILIPILAFFLLKDVQLFRLAAVQIFPRGQLRGRAELFLQDINKTLRAYVRAQLISCLLIGVICTTGFYLLDLRYALLLGLLAAVLEFIPLVGPLIIGILAVTIASFYSSNQAIAVAVFLFVLRMIHDYITYPRIVREGIHLHPLSIILAVLAGGEIGGVTGIFLAIPVVAVATVTYRHLMEHSQSAGIVSELLDEGKTEKAIDVAEEKLEEIHEKALEMENGKRKMENEK